MSAPSAIWSMRCARLARTYATWRRKAFRRLRSAPGDCIPSPGSRSAAGFRASSSARCSWPLPLNAGAVTVDIQDELVSRPYVEMTCKLMARFGVEVMDARQRPSHRAGERRLPQSGADHGGRRCVLGVVLSGRRRDRRWAGARGRRRQRQHPGRRRLCRHARHDGRGGPPRGGLDRGPGKPTAARHRCGLQPHARRGDDGSHGGAVCARNIDPAPYRAAGG